ncbi:hypothetical protein X963_4197 [Burkholderia pseudomallei MSHR7498]|nr:hypothetical protein X963_4197 [Burkholderia pseudomallei MSHR7498]
MPIPPRLRGTACCLYATVKTLTQKNARGDRAKKPVSRGQKCLSKQILIRGSHFYYF